MQMVTERGRIIEYDGEYDEPWRPRCDRCGSFVSYRREQSRLRTYGYGDENDWQEREFYIPCGRCGGEMVLGSQAVLP